MKEETILKSGRKLELALAQFQHGLALMKVVASELKLVEFDMESLQLQGSLEITAMDPSMLNVLKNTVCQMLSSDPLIKALEACMPRCLYDGEKLTMARFDDEKDPTAREDFLPIAWEVIRFNLTPFFKGVDFKSLLPQKNPAVDPPK